MLRSSAAPQSSAVGVLRGCALVALLLCSFLCVSCGGTDGVTPWDRSAGFSVLSEPGSADDSMPPQLNEALELSTEPEFTRLDVALARRVLPEDPVWLVPDAGGGLCLATLDYPLVLAARPLPAVPSYSCSTRPDSLEGKLVVAQSLTTTTRSAHRPTSVYGVVPDGVDQVRVRSGDGRVATSTVIRNGYAAVVDDPERVEFRVRRGDRFIAYSVRVVTPSFKGSTPSSHAASGP